MQIEFNKDKEVDYDLIKYGDVVICENGKSYLIVQDYDKTDYLAVDLQNSIRSEVSFSVKRLFELEVKSKPIQLIKADNIKIGVC